MTQRNSVDRANVSEKFAASIAKVNYSVKINIHENPYLITHVFVTVAVGRMVL